MTNNVNKLFTKILLVISKIKFLSKFTKKILSTFGMAAVASTAVTTGANAAAVTLSTTGSIGSDGNYVAADINQATDTVSNTADAVVVIDGVNASMAFTTLITAADKTLTINMVDTNDIAIGTIDASGDITATAGSTLTINTRGPRVLFDVGGSIVETNTGQAIINLIGISTVNTTGSSKNIDATIIGVATSTLDINGTATFVEAITAGILDIDGATTFTDSVTNLGTSSVGAATTFSSNLIATGAIVFDSATTVAGDLTLSSATATGISNVLTFTGSSITATTAMISDAAASGLTVNGTGDKTIAVQVTPDADDEFKLIQTAASGTVTFTKVMGVDSSTDLALEEADFQASSVSILQAKLHTEILTVAGVITLQDDANVTTNAALAATGTIIIDDTIADGEVIFKLGAGFTDGSIAGTDNIELPSNLDDGETFVLLNGVVNNNTVNAAVVVDAQLAIKDTSLRSYTVSGDTTAETITVTAADNSTATIQTNLGVDANTAKGMMQAVKAAKGTAATLDAFTNTLNERGFAATEDTALALQVSPQLDSQSGAVTSSKAATGKVQGIISNRMASLRSGDAYIQGASAGNMMSANSAFIQAFGSEAEQKTTKQSGVSTPGYDSDTTGIVIGFDGMTEGGSVVGISLSASETDVTGMGTGKSKATIDSYTASLYVDKATDAGYVEGSLTVGYNENENSRVLTSSGLSRSYKGSYDSHQVSLKIGGGVPTEIGDGAYVTPFGSLTGTQITHKKYTETSAGSDDLRLTVDQDDIMSVIGTVGVKAHKVTDYGTPMISLAVNSEVGDDNISASNTYTGGGTAFKTSSDVEAVSATLGLGYSYGSDLVSLDIGYEAEANDDEYLSHYGSVRIVSKF